MSRSWGDDSLVPRRYGARASATSGAHCAIEGGPGMQPSENQVRAGRSQDQTRRRRPSDASGRPPFSALPSSQSPPGLLSRLPLSAPANAAADGRTRSDSPIRVGILLVRSHELLAGAIAVVLELDRDLRVVVVETDARTGLSTIPATQLDVILVDSIPLVPRLRQSQPDLRVIVLGESDDPNVALACVRAGAAGCLDANTTAEMLTDCIKSVHQGHLLYDPDVLVSLLQRPVMPTAAVPKRTARLGNREIEVLQALVQGLTSVQAAEQLGISVHTLRTHTKNIIAKLEARSKLEAVLIALREGRIGMPPAPDMPSSSA